MNTIIKLGFILCTIQNVFGSYLKSADKRELTSSNCCWQNECVSKDDWLDGSDKRCQCGSGGKWYNCEPLKCHYSGNDYDENEWSWIPDNSANCKCYHGQWTECDYTKTQTTPMWTDNTTTKCKCYCTDNTEYTTKPTTKYTTSSSDCCWESQCVAGDEWLEAGGKKCKCSWDESEYKWTECYTP